MKVYLFIFTLLVGNEVFAKTKEISLVFYNLQNFTNYHDLSYRLPRLNHVLKSIGNYPDILVLAEVGGPRILKEILKGSPYYFVIWLSQRDRRGLNLALLMKKESHLVSLKKREIRGPNKRRFRGVLEIELEFQGGKKLFLFINHWPSQLNSFYWRNQFAKYLNLRLESLVTKENIILLGDFNLIPQEVSFLKSHYFLWEKISSFEKNNKIKKTYFYFPFKKWNQLDRIFVSNNLKQGLAGLAMVPNSLKVFNHESWGRNIILRGKKECIPWKFKRLKRGGYTGFSDHFPVGFKIYIDIR